MSHDGAVGTVSGAISAMILKLVGVSFLMGAAGVVLNGALGALGGLAATKLFNYLVKRYKEKSQKTNKNQ